MDQQDFKTFFEQLTDEQRAELARSADTTVVYIEHFLIAGRRLPRPGLLERLTDAASKCGGRFDAGELMAWFMGRSRPARQAQ